MLRSTTSKLLVVRSPWLVVARRRMNQPQRSLSTTVAIPHTVFTIDSSPLAVQMGQAYLARLNDDQEEKDRWDAKPGNEKLDQLLYMSSTDKGCTSVQLGIPLKRNSFELVSTEIVNPGAVVIRKPTIKIVPMYPMRTRAEFVLEATDPWIGFTRMELSESMVRIYEQIYEEEVRTCPRIREHFPDPEEDFSQEMNLQIQFLEGKWKLWGHGVGDLFLHSLDYSPDFNVYLPNVDSSMPLYGL